MIATETHPIPEMTDPLGRLWDQPERSEILLDATHALMSRATLLKLHDYSCSTPTGVYPGKMWRRRKDYYDESKGWYLCWFGDSEKPGYCDNHFREILIVE